MSNDSTVDAAIASVSSKATVISGVVAGWGGLTANEVAAFGGLFLAFIGLLVNWYYRQREDMRQSAEYQARVDRWHAPRPVPEKDKPPHMRTDDGA